MTGDELWKKLWFTNPAGKAEVQQFIAVSDHVKAGIAVDAVTVRNAQEPCLDFM